MPKICNCGRCVGTTTHCLNCQKLLSVKLLSRWTNRPIVKGKTSCTCIQGRYFSPNPDAIPDVLKNLSNSEICSLRPLTVHCGQYTRLPNGYRQKSGTFRLTCCKLSVLEQIEKLDNQPSCTTSCSRCLQMKKESTKRAMTYTRKDAQTVTCLQASCYNDVQQAVTVMCSH